MKPCLGIDFAEFYIADLKVVTKPPNTTYSLTDFYFDVLLEKIGLKGFYFFSDLKYNFKKIINYKRNYFCSDLEIINRFGVNRLPFGLEDHKVIFGPNFQLFKFTYKDYSINNNNYVVYSKLIYKAIEKDV